MSQTAQATQPAKAIRIDTPTATRASAFLFFSFVGWILFRGWQLRDEHYLTAENGVGYALGIIGASMMLLLLLYPLRKNLRAMRYWGPVKYWFRAHMAFGVLGPTLILFHANFSLGSLNSSVALLSMLLVAFSGIIGRFVYSRIHYGLYGRKASLKELSGIVSYNRGQLTWVNEHTEAINDHFQKIENIVMSETHGLGRTFIRWITYDFTAWWHRWQLRRHLFSALKERAVAEGWSFAARRNQKRALMQYLKTYMRTTRKVLEFHFYERLFALWHVVHLPFFFMMLLSGIVHVVAVHMY